MTVRVLELQRARKVLDEFCARRNALLSGSAALLCCSQEGGRLLIGETAPLEKTDVTGRWHLFWPLQGGAWRPYPHLPQVETIQAVVEEFEQAPLHVHWA